MSEPRGTGVVGMPPARIDRIAGPLARFLHIEAASGVVLVVFSALALGLANSPMAESYFALWKTPLTLGFGDFEMRHSLKHWINDALMAVFFFVIGLEVKRELVIGELRDMRRAALPIFAAIGGMVVPAGVYLALQGGGPHAAGWGIPMATDIAFVVGCLALLGSRVPPSLRVLLLSLAIADDIGAVLVIAIGYTADLDVAALVGGGAALAATLACQRLGVRSVGVYILLGSAVWLGFHESGVHATIAGVLLGLLTPTTRHLEQGGLAETVRRAGDFLHGELDDDEEPGLARDPAATRAVLRDVQLAAREGLSPLERLEERLHPWVGFLIMPLFAFANAGVAIQPSYARDPVAIAVALGLVVGKPVGIVLTSFLAVRLGLAQLPPRIGWGVLFGAGCLAGIGFTMALFIAELALEGIALDPAKVGILAGSGIAGALGMALLLRLLPPRADAD